MGLFDFFSKPSVKASKVQSVARSQKPNLQNDSNLGNTSTQQFSDIKYPLPQQSVQSVPNDLEALSLKATEVPNFDSNQFNNFTANISKADTQLDPPDIINYDLLSNYSQPPSNLDEPAGYKSVDPSGVAITTFDNNFISAQPLDNTKDTTVEDSTHQNIGNVSQSFSDNFQHEVTNLDDTSSNVANLTDIVEKESQASDNNVFNPIPQDNLIVNSQGSQLQTLLPENSNSLKDLSLEGTDLLQSNLDTSTQSTQANTLPSEVNPIDDSDFIDLQTGINTESNAVVPIEEVKPIPDVLEIPEQQFSEQKIEKPAVEMVKPNLSKISDLSEYFTKNPEIEEIQSEKEPEEDVSRIESIPEPVNLSKFLVFKKFGILGLNSVKVRQEILDTLTYLISSVINSCEEVIVDSNKNYGASISKIAEESGVKFTGVYLRPFYSSYSDESESLSTNPNYTAIVYSDFIEKLRHIAKECDIFLIPEVEGLNNISELFALWNLQLMYLGHNKPVILLGKNWIDILSTLKNIFKIGDLESKAIYICENPKEALDLILKLDDEYSKKKPIVYKKIIDKRTDSDENGYFIG